MPLPDDQPHTRTRLPVGEQSSPQPPSRQTRPLRTLLTVLVVVALLVLAISIANRGKTVPGAGTGTSGDSSAQGGSGGRPGAAPPTAPSGDQPVTATSNGIGVGYPHTEQGAQSAAANYAVALGGADMFRADGRHAILAAIADPSAVATLQSRLDQALTPDALAGYGLDPQGRAPSGLTFVSRATPVGTKTSGYTADSTQAMVWCVGLGGLAGTSSTKPVTANWYTVTLTLHWTGNDWKLTDFNRQSGPAPVPADQQAANAEEITGAVQQFGGFRYAR
ncbi:hypothetical protein P3T36_003620 [Kitasatospora sp. MAP12-15]|uniref:hypothetical protein n=1 Tax=unclassified Kitasatospora TaxID=2633591 RepID=UPI002475E9DB|nr:hypothetical protein [Kitasatospora sp. MAP12-44]MDH6112210.1 hypothetical protein [Kitasatospora sp. MAP12-44]